MLLSFVCFLGLRHFCIAKKAELEAPGRQRGPAREKSTGRLHGSYLYAALAEMSYCSTQSCSGFGERAGLHFQDLCPAGWLQLLAIWRHCKGRAQAYSPSAPCVL